MNPVTSTATATSTSRRERGASPGRSRWRRRSGQLLAAFAVAAAASAATAVPASAASAGACRTGSDYTVCFSVTQSGSRTYVVHIGIDVTMSQARAQEIIDASGSGVVIALVYGVDPLTTDRLFGMDTAWSEAGPGGLAAELELRVEQWRVNEDDNWFDRRDELLAVVGVYGHAPIESAEISAYF